MTAKFLTSLNSLEKELSLLDILLRRNPSVSRNFDYSKVRDLTYFDYWASYYRESWYDFQLKDLSLLSFNENEFKGVVFIYLGSPVRCSVSEDEYYSTEELYASGVIYGDYVLSCPRVENASYLRYDNAVSMYNTGLHPANHFHFGYDQHNRVGCSYHLDAVAFVAFVLRQNYPDEWNYVLNHKESFSTLYGYKSKVEKIESRYYQDIDRSHDLYLL